MNIFSEIHCGLPREGPGCNEATKRAFSGISNIPTAASVLDLGCGPGLQTIELSQLLKVSNGSITAVDHNETYLEELALKVSEQSIDNIKCEKADMCNLHYADNSFDIIWAEGAIYIIGFKKGLKEWKRILKPSGIIAVTELSWIADDIPKEISEFWSLEYSEMQSVEENINTANVCGFHVESHFTLPESAWFNDYYAPLEIRINELKVTYEDNEEAQKVLNNELKEIVMYKQYSAYYGYEFYVLRSTK